MMVIFPLQNDNSHKDLITIMDDKIIFLEEVRIRNSIEETTRVLKKARELVASGYELPETTIERLEYILAALEEKLIEQVEHGSDYDPDEE